MAGIKLHLGCVDGDGVGVIFSPSALSCLKRESTGWGRELVNRVYVNEPLVNKQRCNPL